MPDPARAETGKLDPRQFPERRPLFQECMASVARGGWRRQTGPEAAAVGRQRLTPRETDGGKPRLLHREEIRGNDPSGQTPTEGEKDRCRKGKGRRMLRQRGRQAVCLSEGWLRGFLGLASWRSFVH